MEKIGICDWGIGGIGLYQALKTFSNISVVYLSDAGFTPYGKVPKEELLERWKQVIAFFESHEITHIAVACNALSTVVEANHNFITVVESGLELMQKLDVKDLGIVGGVRTVKSEIYKIPLEKKGFNIEQVVGQKLSARVEAGDLSSDALMEEIYEIFSQFKKSKNILLACTHYPVLTQLINEQFAKLSLHDPAKLMAKKIANNWALQAVNHKDEWYTTGDVNQTIEAAMKGFNQKLLDCRKVEL